MGLVLPVMFGSEVRSPATPTSCRMAMSAMGRVTMTRIDQARAALLLRPKGHPDGPVEEEELELADHAAPGGQAELLAEGDGVVGGEDRPQEAIGQEQPLEDTPLDRRHAPGPQQHGQPDHAR